MGKEHTRIFKTLSPTHQIEKGHHIMGFNHRDIEKKWQKYWSDNHTFKTDVYDFSKPKFYALDMFPYPSGTGLHAGHPEGYTATDIVSRMKRMQGYNVLHPMGYDSLVYRRNNMPFKQVIIQVNSPTKTSLILQSNSRN